MSCNLCLAAGPSEAAAQGLPAGLTAISIANLWLPETFCYGHALWGFLFVSFLGFLCAKSRKHKGVLWEIAANRRNGREDVPNNHQPWLKGGKGRISSWLLNITIRSETLQLDQMKPETKGNWSYTSSSLIAAIISWAPSWSYHPSEPEVKNVRGMEWKACLKMQNRRAFTC